MSAPLVTGFYHEPTFSIAYLVEDPATGRAAIIDPVLDYDHKAGRVSHEAADEMLRVIGERRLTVDWILDTHPHADHFSAAVYLKEKLGAPTAIGEKITDVQELWKKIYNLPDFPADGSQWDRLFAHGDTFADRQSAGARDVLARAYQGVDHLRGRQRGVHPRHAVPAGLRRRAHRFSRRRSGRVLSLDHGDPRAARRHAAVHRPRLPAERPPRRVGIEHRRAVGERTRI